MISLSLSLPLGESVRALFTVNLQKTGQEQSDLKLSTTTVCVCVCGLCVLGGWLQSQSGVIGIRQEFVAFLSFCLAGYVIFAVVVVVR